MTPEQRELKTCPFCGGAARIESNRDWHRLYADHDEDCALYDANDLLMFPAQPGYLKEIADLWNRRAQVEALTVPQGVPTAEQYDEMLRSLCCCYGVGGYNSDGLIDPKVAESKLRFALDEQFRVGGELSFNHARGELRAAAAAVVARWDSPKWKDEAPTADFIARLRRALSAPTIPAIPGTKEGA